MNCIMSNNTCPESHIDYVGTCTRGRNNRLNYRQTSNAPSKSRSFYAYCSYGKRCLKTCFMSCRSSRIPAIGSYKTGALS